MSLRINETAGYSFRFVMIPLLRRIEVPNILTKSTGFKPDTRAYNYNLIATSDLCGIPYHPLADPPAVVRHRLDVRA